MSCGPTGSRLIVISSLKYLHSFRIHEDEKRTYRQIHAQYAQPDCLMPNDGGGTKIILLYQNGHNKLLIVLYVCLTFIAGYKGNLTEHVLIMVLCLVFTVTSFFGFLYLLLWQTYVLRADVILNSIQITFIGLEVIFGIVCIIMFARYSSISVLLSFFWVSVKVLQTLLLSCYVTVCYTHTYVHKECLYSALIQVAQLSQRDRAAGCVSFRQKWKTGTGRQYFSDIIGLSSTTVT